MLVFATRRHSSRQLLSRLLTGLITSVALIGGQPLSTVHAETAQSPISSSPNVDGAFGLTQPGPTSIWTAPPLADYPFERVETPTAAPAPVAEPTPETTATAPAEEAQAPQESLVDVGIASTYGVGDGFQGRRTACGQRFDTNVPQVAHKSLPCGTMVRVEDATSGKSVLAQVTDRGPYVRGRVVDLSWAAFSQLRPSPDLVSVRVYRLLA